MNSADRGTKNTAQSTITMINPTTNPERVKESLADRNFEPPFCGLAAPAALPRKSDCVKAAAGRGAEAALTTPSSPQFSALTRPMHASDLAARSTARCSRSKPRAHQPLDA